MLDHQQIHGFQFPPVMQEAFLHAEITALNAISNRGENKDRVAISSFFFFSGQYLRSLRMHTQPVALCICKHTRTLIHAPNCSDRSVWRTVQLENVCSANSKNSPDTKELCTLRMTCMQNTGSLSETLMLGGHFHYLADKMWFRPDLEALDHV